MALCCRQRGKLRLRDTRGVWGGYTQDTQDLGARHGLWGFYLAMDAIEGCPIGLGFVCCL